MSRLKDLTKLRIAAYLSWSTSPNRTETGHTGAIVYLWHTGKLDLRAVKALAEKVAHIEPVLR